MLWFRVVEDGYVVVVLCYFVLLLWFSGFVIRWHRLVFPRFCGGWLHGVSLKHCDSDILVVLFATVCVRFHFPFVGLSGCQDGGGNGLTKTSLITHLHDRHYSSEAQAIIKHPLSTNLTVFRRPSGDGVVEFVFYGFTKPQVSCSQQLIHVDDLLHDQHDGFTLALIDSLFSKGLCTIKSIPLKCHLGFSWVLKGALDKVICKPDNISCWVSLLVLPLCLLKNFRPRSGSLQLIRETLAELSPSFLDVDEENLDLSERNIKQCKRKIYDGHYTTAVRVLSSFIVAPYNEATLEDLKSKHPFKPASSVPHIAIDHHHLIASPSVVLDRIKSFPRGTSCRRDGLCAQHLMDCLSGAVVAISNELVSSITQVVNLFLDGKCPKMLGEYIASTPLTPLVKSGDGIYPIAVGTIWRRLVSKVSVIMIGYCLNGYLDDLQFDVGVSRGGEAILYAVNRLIKDRGDDVGISIWLVDFKNSFNLVDREVMLQKVRLRCPAILRWVEFCYSNPARYIMGNTLFGHVKGFNKAWYLDDGIIVGDTLVVGKVLELIMKDGQRCGLHLNVDKIEYVDLQTKLLRHAGIDGSGL
nr:hypothetical protein [Tanacetum cinerariifolium]